MTTTIEPGNITKGTLCRVRVPDPQDLPLHRRDMTERVLAVRSSADYGWMVLLPNPEPDGDEYGWGWRMSNDMIGSGREDLNVEGFVTTHRGWWVPNVEVIETVAGHWCPEHKVFHAAETCPEEFADIPEGTLCWVKTGERAPSNWQNKDRVLAVKRSPGSILSWLLLLPCADPWATQEYDGWVLDTHLAARQIEEWHLESYVTTHRGWWAPDAEFIERYVPEDAPREDADPSVLSGLRTQLADAEERAAAAVKALEDFKINVSEILGQEADERDWCGEYDEIAIRAGLIPRARDYQVDIEVAYRQTVTVKAHSREAAENLVRDMSQRPLGDWRPEVPLSYTFEDSNYPSGVEVTVIDA